MGKENTSGGVMNAGKRTVAPEIPAAPATTKDQAPANAGDPGGQDEKYTLEQRIIIGAFCEAINEYKADPEADELREILRNLSGAAPGSPFELFIMGFLMGFDKALEFSADLNGDKIE